MRLKAVILAVVIIIAMIVLSLMLPKEEGHKIAAVVGLEAPDFQLKDTNGNVWKLSNLKGRVVFVNFWASWCAPCREEMPYMESLHKKMQGRPFQMLAILYKDDPATAMSYMKRNGLDFPVLLDPDGKTAKEYGITGVPETYLVDKTSILRKKFVGPEPWDSPEALALIGEML